MSGLLLVRDPSAARSAAGERATVLRMYYTPGWGSIATTTVAVVAIVITSFYNSRTLRAASSRFETEKSDRLRDKRRDSIVEVLHNVGRLTAVWNAIYTENRKALADASPGTDTGQRAEFEKYIRGDAMDVVTDLDRALIAAELLAGDGTSEHHIHALRAYLLDVAKYFQELPRQFPVSDHSLTERRRLYAEDFMAKNAEALRVLAIKIYQRGA